MSAPCWELPSFNLSLENLGRLAVDAEAMKAADEKLRARFKSGKVGFYDWPRTCPKDEVARIKKTADKLRARFEGVLCIGIGGSYLGPAAVQQALRTPEEEAKFPMRWLSNVDAAAVRDTAHFARERRVATVVISKSGGTTETLAGFFHLSHELDEKGYVMITDPKVGELRRLATKNGWESFEVPPAIGGRFSVLTAVGLLPAALAGIDAWALLAGAKAMSERLDSAKPGDNPAYRFGWAAYQLARQGKSIQYLMPYATNLKLLADWYVQLWAESLGKQEKGLTPVAALGTSDQHSVLQLLKDGPRDKVVGFIDVASAGDAPKVGKPAFDADKAFSFLYQHDFATIAQKASFATEKSLNNSGVPTYRFSLPRVDASALGAFFFFHETACAFAAELFGIDAFDQPGVEEAKRLLRQSL